MSDKLNRFTQQARVALADAAHVAVAAHSDTINPEHLLSSLSRDPHNLACVVLNQLGISNRRFAVAAMMATATEKNVNRNSLTLSGPMKRVIELAVDEARRMGHTQISTAHILLGLLRNEEGIEFDPLKSLGVTLDAARSTTMQAVQDRKVAEARDVPIVEIEKGGDAETGETPQEPKDPE